MGTRTLRKAQAVTIPITAPITSFQNKNVVVTGASGLIGSYVVKILKESGARVKAIINSRPANEFTRMANEVVPFNLLNCQETESAVQGADVVIGCAGITGGVGITKADPLSYVGPASVMVLNTLDACARLQIPRFGFLSSTTVYPPSDQPVREDLLDFGSPPYALYSGIGWSKRMLEKICAYYNERSGTKIAIVRPSGAYGRFDNFDEVTSHVIPGMINRALRVPPGEPFEIWGDGNDVRDFIHAQDVAYGFLLAIAISEDCTAFNIASGRGITTRELAETILACIGNTTSPVITNTSKLSALKTRLVDIEKAKSLIGFSPRIDLATGLSDTISWKAAH